jgi:phosphoribosylglycinamide formyltransferase-1
MSEKIKVGVLISGRGSNLQALIEACADPSYPAEIVLVISNAPGVQGLERARAASIATVVIDHRQFQTRKGFDEALDIKLKEAGVELVCLAGFMRILSEPFVRKWEGRMINIHPSLLPSFKGTHVHEQAIAAGVKISGCTVHYVSPELDSGRIIFQLPVVVFPEDDAEALAMRVLEVEHQAYPMALKGVAAELLGKKHEGQLLKVGFVTEPTKKS